MKKSSILTQSTTAESPSKFKLRKVMSTKSLAEKSGRSLSTEKQF